MPSPLPPQQGSEILDKLTLDDGRRFKVSLKACTQGIEFT
jgi:hypothetical protein